MRLSKVSAKTELPVGPRPVGAICSDGISNEEPPATLLSLSDSGQESSLWIIILD